MYGTELNHQYPHQSRTVIKSLSSYIINRILGKSLTKYETKYWNGIIESIRRFSSNPHENSIERNQGDARECLENETRNAYT